MGAEHMKPQCEVELDEVIRMGTNIEQLIQELCPDGVPYRPLGELGIFVRGAGIQKSDLQSEGHPAIHYGQIHTYYGLSCFQTVSFISPEKAEKAKKAEPGDLVIVTTSEDTSAVAKAVAWEGESEVAVSGDALIFKHSLVNKYLSYVFQSGVFQSAKDRLVNGTKVRRVSPKDLGRIQVPVPPVEVQEEIVRILDLFTTLEAELEAELEKRVAQYAHYRDFLFSFEESGLQNMDSDRRVRWLPLGEIADVYSGYGFPKNEQGCSVGSFPFYKVSDMNNAGNEVFVSNAANYVDADALLRLKASLRPAGTVIFPKIGAAIATNKKRILSREAAYDNNVMGVVPREGLDFRFLYYWFQGVDLMAIAQHSGAVPSIRKGDIQSLPFPMLEIEEQRRIAGILDQMDALVNDLSSGLPAEIAARRKQYEYYRDRLLSFPELTEPAAMASPNTQEPTRP